MSIRKRSGDMNLAVPVKFPNRRVITPSHIFSQNLQARLDEQKQLKNMMEEEYQKNKGKETRKSKTNKQEELQKALTGNEKILSLTFHSDNLEELLASHNSSATEGLTTEEAAKKIKEYGPNELEEKKGLPWYCLFLKEMSSFFSILLWGGSILCFIGYGLAPDDQSNLYLGIVLAAVVFITGCFSYYQTSKSAALMAKFKNYIPPMANVIRDGEKSGLAASQLVPGDIVEIISGDNIPADVRIIQSNEMKVDNSSLTGESDELLRTDHSTHESILETANMAFFGTKCTFGKGKGVVVLTGGNTVIGQIAYLAQTAESEETTMSLELKRFIKIVSAVAIFLGVTFFIFGIIYQYDIITDIVFCIGIIVANVPEGLLATVTVSLALTAKKMYLKKVLVKNMESIETLGSTSCICSDKTGTLTQNIMTVSQMWVEGAKLDCSMNKQEYDELKRAEPEIPLLDYSMEDKAFADMVMYVSCSTRAYFDENPTEELLKKRIGEKLGKKGKDLKQEEIDTHRKVVSEVLRLEEREKPYKKKQTNGDASESGLIKFVSAVLPPIPNTLEIEREKFPLNKTEKCDSEIPFNSVNKYNLMIRKIFVDEGSTSRFSHFLLLMKGAPEKIWTRCTSIRVGTDEGELVTQARDQMWDNKFKEINTEFGEQGERVLAFACLKLDPLEYPEDYPFDPQAEVPNFPMQDLIFNGLVSLNDPPRVGVEESVEICKEAHIKVIMVTGDQPVTAKAIAEKCNIITHPEEEMHYLMEHKGLSEAKALEECKAIVIHGDTLAKMNAADQSKDDSDPDKGSFLRDWIKVEQVVFARTTPSQKLLIVNGCQSLNHIVAVTGDGVNDSPAIKKANIGIAMGSGADVARDAADMLLLDDNFTSIVNGVEEGRLIFDNLKKSIAYTLSSNIPEIAPFLFFIVFQLPLPLSTVLILCIDLGTDMVPAISLAYEGAELDIMERYPRNSKIDHLVNAKLISFSYLQVGMIQAAAAFYTYFVVMYDYGFYPRHLFMFALNEACEDDPNGNWDKGDRYLWDRNDHNDITMQEFFRGCKGEEYDWHDDIIDKESHVSGHDIAYTSEALRHAQTAYLISIIIVQWADILICKTRKLSISQQGMKNNMLTFGLFFETGLGALLCYVPFLNKPLGTRPLDIRHFGLPAFPFFVIIFTYDEIRKYIIRRTGDKGWMFRNTYY